MSVTSYLASGTCADDSGVGTIAWVSDDLGSALAGTEVSSDNNVYAGFQGASLATSHWLKCTNFGFTGTDVPTGSTIDGFEIEVRQFRSAVPTVTSTTVKFVQGGTISGSDIGVAGDWATSETVVTYGNSTQKGGLSWSQSDVVASNFGCAISLVLSSTRILPSGRSHFIDQVRMRVYYTAGGGGGTATTPWMVAQTVVMPPETTTRIWWSS